ncbi:MAG: hypothetical protein ABFS22_04760 [Pseudomonadota bacterium]
MNPSSAFRSGITGKRLRDLMLVLLLGTSLYCHADPDWLLAGEWSGYAGTEVRYFPSDALDQRQHGNSNLSLMGEPEYYAETGDRSQSLTFTPFYRWDEHDSKRTHFDVRELVWQYVGDDWELRAGVSKVFWGVAESQHLVDIINQTDLVENIDEEDKLGQPMINLALIRDWGTVDLFVLPYFRERTFPGKKGRLRSSPHVDTSNPIYDSSRKKKHIDLAMRWSHYIGDWDFGLAHFYGTTRQPLLIPAISKSGEPVLLPRYDIINQTSLDVQATKGDWLWKLEAMTRSGQDDRFYAFVGGFEYTWVGVFDSSADLGFIGEYHNDDRDELAPTPFEDDSMVGLRFTMNDAQSTELLLGVIYDNDGDAITYNLEASRRLGDNWLLEVESRLFTEIDKDDPLRGFRDDDYLQVSLTRHF